VLDTTIRKQYND